MFLLFSKPVKPHSDTIENLQATVFWSDPMISYSTKEHLPMVRLENNLLVLCRSSLFRHEWNTQTKPEAKPSIWCLKGTKYILCFLQIWSYKEELLGFCVSKANEGWTTTEQRNKAHEHGLFCSQNVEMSSGAQRLLLHIPVRKTQSL